MRRAVQLFLLTALAFGILACASTEKPAKITPIASDKMIKKAPDWFLSPPTKSGMLFAPGTATSRDMQMAKDKAAHTARLDLARGLESHFTALTKRFQEEVGTDLEAQYLEQFTQTTKEVVDVTLSGVQQEDLEMFNEEGVFRCYVLLKMDLDAANAKLLDKIKQQEQLLTMLRATEAFQELDKSVAPEPTEETVPSP